MVKRHRAGQQLEFKPGNYIIEFNLDQDRESYVEYIDQLLITDYATEQDDYIIRATCDKKITKIDRNTLHVKTPKDGDITFYYSPGYYSILSEEQYNKLIIKYPIRFKVDDKLINPYLNIPDDIINKSEEVFKEGVDIRTASILLRKNHNLKRSDHKRIPYLTIIDIETKILFNVKYNKPLAVLVHTYRIKGENTFDNTSIIGKIDQNAADGYISHNEFWSDLCTPLK